MIEIIIISFFVIIIVLLLLCIPFYMGKAAYKLGYSGFLWAVISYPNPILIMSFLSSLPNKKFAKKRKDEHRILENKLKKLEHSNTESSNASFEVDDDTISDDQTIR